MVGDSIMLQLFKYLLLQTENSSKSSTRSSTATFVVVKRTFHVPESNTTISYVSFLDGDSLDSLDDIFDESDVIIWNVGIHWHDPGNYEDTPGNYEDTIRAVGARLRSFYAERPQNVWISSAKHWRNISEPPTVRETTTARQMRWGAWPSTRRATLGGAT